jgi:hypothetical protein
LAEQADGVKVPDGMGVPEELQRREDRLMAIAEVKGIADTPGEPRRVGMPHR